MEYYQDYLSHHGVLGQRWGVRRYQNKYGKLTPLGKKRREQSMKNSESHQDQSNETTDDKVPIKKMSDQELRDRSTRIRLENEYIRNLNEYNRNLDSINKKTTSRGKKIIQDCLESSGRKVLTQVMTYAMGKAVNNLLGDEVVQTNKKKGNNDKKDSKSSNSTYSDPMKDLAKKTKKSSNVAKYANMLKNKK